MMRSPACSIIALTAPVRLRSVASGLMIEKVRSIAIVIVLFWKGLSRNGLPRLIAAGPACGKDVAANRRGSHAADERRFMRAHPSFIVLNSA
jgi:hypothetical protein